jgi:hypothetical protein
MVPECIISELCWQQVTTELDRVAPREGILVPLCALDPRDPGFNPCRTLALGDLGRVVIASVVLVPRAHQDNRLLRVSVLPHTDRLVNERIESLARRFPRLRACAYLHSHPFACGGTAPSRGPSGDVEGHMLPLWRSNQAAALDTSFSFIACRDAFARGWVLLGFALDGGGELVSLGRVRVVANDAAAVTAALVPSLSRRPVTRSLLRGLRRRLARSGVAVQSDDLFDGWRRLVACRREARAVILVPPDFPCRALRAFVVPGPGQAAVEKTDPVWSTIAPDALAAAVRAALEVKNDHAR